MEIKNKFSVRKPAGIPYTDFARIRVFFIPAITLILVAVNILIYGFTAATPPFKTGAEALNCVIASNYNCLGINSEREYIGCALDMSCLRVNPASDCAARELLFKNAPQLCLYNLGNCTANGEILSRCFSFEDGIIYRYGFTPKLAASRPYSLITSIFIHSGLDHLLGNMIFLLLAGAYLEKRIGSRNFLIFYLLSGIGASFFYLLFNFGSAIVAIGASGAIAGLLAANLVLSFYLNKEAKEKYFFLNIGGKAFSAGYLIIFFLMQLYLAVLSDLAGGFGVAFGAHIGGFITGFILTFFFKNRREKYIGEEVS